MPAHFNAYAYSVNNPVTLSDPSGAIPEDLAGKKSSGGKYKPGAGKSKPAPPPTSWAARDQCEDVWCLYAWGFNAQGQVVGGIAEGLGELALMLCTTCQAIQALSDWDAHIERTAAGITLLQAGPDAWYQAIVVPYVHNWENNPGNAAGHLYVDIASIAIPAGAGVALKGARVAAKAAEAAQKAARAPIGFAEGLGQTALTGNRLQHGTRHLTESGVLPAWSGKNSPDIIKRALVPILEHPTATFEHTVGGTATRGFLGEIDGQQVAVFVYSEGQYQGQLATSFVPTSNQLKLWGVQ